jgi:putative membrane protein
MFVDYVTLLLVNMVAGLVVLAVVVLKGLDPGECRPWAAASAMVGFVAVAGGLHMSLTWPLPGSYNCAFGEMSVLFGVCFLGAALAIAKGWALTGVAVYAVFAGAAAVVVGAGIIKLGLTVQPGVAGVGFILTGLGGMLILPALRLRKVAAFRVLVAIILLAAAAIWALTGYVSYPKHLSGFTKWTPATMRQAGVEPR